MRKALILVAIWLLVPASGAGQTDSRAQTDPRLTARVDEGILPDVVVMLQEAAERGLPTEPLIDKTLEGSSRNVPGAMIVAAVRRLLDGMGRVQEVLGPGAGDSELSAGAHALRAGATAASLRALQRARGGEDLTTPFGVLYDLIAIGVDPGTATAAVAYATARGASDTELLELQRAVVNDIRAGYPPVVAASVRSGMPTAVPPPLAPAVAEGVRTPEP